MELEEIEVLFSELKKEGDSSRQTLGKRLAKGIRWLIEKNIENNI